MNDGKKSSRRTFLSEASKVTAAGLVAGEAVLAAEEKKADVLRIGLIGCGGRGSGAVTDAVAADSNVQLVAMADVFRDKLDASRERLQKAIGDKFAVDEDHEFIGFDAYQKLLQSDVHVSSQVGVGSRFWFDIYQRCKTVKSHTTQNLVFFSCNLVCSPCIVQIQKLSLSC